MVIIVTGSGGYIGQALIRRLWELGHEVIEVDIKGAVTGYNVKKTWQMNELIDTSTPDAVIHLAAMRNVTHCEEEVTECYRTNFCAAVDLARCCKETDIKFIFASTMAADIKKVEANAYIETKRLAEKYLQQLNNTTIVRLTNVVGGYEGYRMHSYPSLTENIIRAINGEHQLTIHGDALRNFVYIDDVVNGFIEAFDSTDKEINIQGPITAYTRDWVHRVTLWFGAYGLKYKEAPPKPFESQSMGYHFRPSDAHQYFAKIMESYTPFVKEK